MLPSNKFKFPELFPEMEPEKDEKFIVITTFWETFATITLAAAVEINTNELWFIYM